MFLNAGRPNLEDSRSRLLNERRVYEHIGGWLESSCDSGRLHD